MPDIMLCASPMEDWRSFKFICADSGGWFGGKNAYRAGQPWLYVVGDTVGYLLEDAEFGDEGVLVYIAEKMLVAKVVDAQGVFGVGDVVYWDPISRLATNGPASAHYRIGICTESALKTDPLVEIDLDGAGAAIRP